MNGKHINSSLCYNVEKHILRLLLGGGGGEEGGQNNLLLLTISSMAWFGTELRLKVK